MFENLQDKLQGVFDQLTRRGRLSEADVDKALREVRLALLEADVNFKVVKGFIGRVRERLRGAPTLRQRFLGNSGGDGWRQKSSNLFHGPMGWIPQMSRRRLIELRGRMRFLVETARIA